MQNCSDVPPPDQIIKKPEPEPTDSFILRVSAEMPPLRIPSDNPFTKKRVELGRMLFYDRILSGNDQQACADCHNLSLGFTDNGKAFSEGIRGNKGTRNSMPIFNLMWVDNHFWDGRAQGLRHLATMPIENPLEMDARMAQVLNDLNQSALYKQWFKEAYNTEYIDTLHVSMALEQFLLTIVSDNSKFDRVNQGLATFTESEAAGFEVMKQKGCFSCHSGILMHDNKFHNIGLDGFIKDKGRGEITGKSEDLGLVRTPSLRNIAVTAPYMHDGRFGSLSEVIDFYDNDIHFEAPNISHNELQVVVRNKLSPVQKQNILDFLQTLTDPTYLNNSAYKSPF